MERNGVVDLEPLGNPLRFESLVLWLAEPDEAERELKSGRAKVATRRAGMGVGRAAGYRGDDASLRETRPTGLQHDMGNSTLEKSC